MSPTKMQTWAPGIALCLLATLATPRLRAQDFKTPYPRMAPVEQYLMDRNDEIALARSAAPEAISQNATVLVLSPHGYETAVEGTNGFVCMVERGWVGTLDWPERWNPKIRGADCLNAAAARSILPMAEMRTSLFLAGHSLPEVVASLKRAIASKQVPALGPGAMSYMLGKGSYLTDQGSHNLPHLMFFMPLSDPALWGAGVKGSPVGSAAYWFTSEKDSEGFPPLRIFTVQVSKWSDGTAVEAQRK